MATLAGRLLIDGIDAYNNYGIFVKDGGLNGLIAMPSFKAIDTYDWHEENGVDADLTAPVLDGRQFQMTFWIVDRGWAEDLFADLSNGAYHEFYFPRLQRTYTLRLVSNGTFTNQPGTRYSQVTLTFAEDDPSLPTMPVDMPLPYGASGVSQNGYEIDGADLSQFGMWVTKGTDQTIYKAANVKDNLKVNLKQRQGIIYDPQDVRFKARDITLHLHLKTATIGEFWSKWDALFATLMQPDERVFFFNTIGTYYNCYYKSCSVSKFIIDDSIVWCDFSVVLTCLSYTAETEWLYLITEDGQYVITEDGARIRIRPRTGLALLITQDGQFVTTEDGNYLLCINNS